MRSVAILSLVVIGITAMGLFSWFSGRHGEEKPADGGLEQMPWDQHPSIYEHIAAHIKPNRSGLTEGGDSLPDESRLKGTLRWVAGGQDGVFSHHVAAGDNSEKAQALLKIVQTYCSTPTALNKKAIYDYLVQESAIEFIDPFLDALTKDNSINQGRLYECVKSFATSAPDREPVKVAIALLGVFRRPDDRSLLLTLGRHEEFTLYAAVALRNLSDDSERDLWELAQNIHGWGRINVVDRLANTHDPKIKDWLLREGYKNSVMYEYLAYTSAVAGELKSALAQGVIDDNLLDSASDIINALIQGGPAQNMDDYGDGSAVVERFLVLIDGRATSLKHFLTVSAIKGYLANETADWAARGERGWTAEKRAVMTERCSVIMGKSIWREQTLKELDSSDEQVFFDADRAAVILGLDTWPVHWRRLQSSPGKSGNWYPVMKLCNQERIAEVVALAEKSIPLKEIATGAGKELGLGQRFEPNGCLDYVLQDLGRFPGLGYKLIEAGLKSPVVRNRHMAIKALSEWGQSKWPPEARGDLSRAFAVEPDEAVRKRMHNVLDGKPLE